MYALVENPQNFFFRKLVYLELYSEDRLDCTDEQTDHVHAWFLMLWLIFLKAKFE